jgi:hypothetical protein
VNRDVDAGRRCPSGGYVDGMRPVELNKLGARYWEGVSNVFISAADERARAAIDGAGWEALV